MSRSITLSRSKGRNTGVSQCLTSGVDRGGTYNFLSEINGQSMVLPGGPTHKIDGEKWGLESVVTRISPKRVGPQEAYCLFSTCRSKASFPPKTTVKSLQVTMNVGRKAQVAPDCRGIKTKFSADRES